MNDMQATLDSTRIRWLRTLAVAAGVTMLALLAPLIWGAVVGGAGLLVLGALLAAGFAATQALPLLGQWLENRLLGLRKAQARRNPMEQMQNHLLYRARQIEGFRDALAGIGGQIEGMREMLRQRAQDNPGHDLTRQNTALQKMQAFYIGHTRKLVTANAALEQYRQHVEMKVFEWNFAQHGRVVLDKLKATDQERILREMLSDEASRSVQDRFNRVFAELDLEARTLVDGGRIDFGGGLQIDLTALESPAGRVPEVSS
jgi:hypothetical protein